jgi:hypothetical protein
VRAFIGAISKAKPSGVKGTYIMKASISSTMGPGIKLDMPNALGNDSGISSPGFARRRMAETFRGFRCSVRDCGCVLSGAPKRETGRHEAEGKTEFSGYMPVGLNLADS